MAAAMNCDEANDLLALEAVGGLEPSDRAEMERHVASCAACRQLAAQYADVASLLPAALEQVQPPARLRRNLMAQVYAEASPKRATEPWWQRLVALIPANRAITAVGAVAVVAALVFGIWGMPGRRTASPTVSYTVSGGTSQESVSGTLDVDTTANQSVLTVDGLADLPSNEVYEVWLIPAHGAPKGVAFLTPSPSGAGWTAVVSGSLEGYDSVAATSEPVGGSPAPTGAQVLIGQLTSS